MSNNNGHMQQMRQRAMEGARPKDKHSSNMFNLRKGLREILVIFHTISLINVLLYNTGWVSVWASTFKWEHGNGGVIWACTVAGSAIAGIVLMHVLDK